NLIGFIGAIFNFLRRNGIPVAVITFFTKDGAPVEPGTGEITWDSVQESLLRGALLYLPFSDFNNGNPLPCADGGCYSILSTDSFGEADQSVPDEQVEMVGFLTSVAGESLTIQPSVLRCGEYEALNPDESAGELNEFSAALERFVKGFVKG
ncbi:MAG: hypothetical protein ACM3YE_15720, partial [Bacteroidota bacterium]